MGFSTALSGLNAASKNLQVIGNNIANANTVGFKESRAEFADVYTSVGKVAPGTGVKVSEIAQQFNQGNIDTTQNNLDLAISGNGFLAMGDKTSSTTPVAYTRNGAFNLDPNGFITNDAGFYLMGGAPIGSTVADGFNLGAPRALQITTAQGSPKATTQIDLKINLDSRGTRFAPASFVGFTADATGAFTVPPDPTTYNDSTAATIFDSLGNPHTLSTYFVDVTADGATQSTWESYLYLDGRAITVPSTLEDNAGVGLGSPIPMVFDAKGNLVADTTGTNNAAGSADPNFVLTNLDIAPLNSLNVSANKLSFKLNPTGTTQYASKFGVNDLQQDGYASGNLTGINIDKQGVILAQFSNGTSSPLGQILMGRFSNNQGLEKTGDTIWKESVDSGTVVLGTAGGNNFGNIQSKALESSNTDISTQLVKLIVAQQAYQANAKTISTENQIIQRILQL